MRLLLITPYPPARDGIGTYSQALGEQLAVQGNEVRVVAVRSTATHPPEVIGFIRQRSQDTDGALEQIKRFNPDVVHVQFAVAAYAASVFALVKLIDQLRKAGYPLVITMHEVTRDTDSLRLVGRMLYRKVAGAADLVIVHTREADACLMQLLRRPVETQVIAHPQAALPESTISTAELRQQFALGKSRIVLSFGFIDVDKGLLDLVRASAAQRPLLEALDVRLVIAGSVRRRFGPFRIFELRDQMHLRAVKRSVARAGLTELIRFAGYVPSGSIQSWFDVAEFAVLPYRRCEASGVANIAGAAGTPVLATSVGELVSLSMVPGLRPKDVPALSAALAKLLVTGRDTEHRTRRLGLTFHEAARQTLDVYRIVTSRHGR